MKRMIILLIALAICSVLAAQSPNGPEWVTFTRTSPTTGTIRWSTEPSLNVVYYYLAVHSDETLYMPEPGQPEPSWNGGTVPGFHQPLANYLESPGVYKWDYPTALNPAKEYVAYVAGVNSGWAWQNPTSSYHNPPAPAIEFNWSDGVTGNVDTGTPSVPLIHGVDGICPYANQIPFNGTIGHFFTLTLDDATFPVDVTITLDHVALGYAPGQIGWYVVGFGWTFDPDPWLGVPLVWTNPGTANASVTITITNAKKDRADTDVTIAFSGTADGPLPVTLSSFTAVFSGSSSILNWTTQSEVNNFGWNIYRANSNDYLNSSKINPTIINGAGTTSELTQYSYVDNSGFEYNATYYYWLESVDYANVSTFHGPISLTIEAEEIPALPESTLLHAAYPNPFNPQTTITFSIKDNETGTLSIYNAKGQIVLTKDFSAGNHDFVWQADRQASGVYFYQLKTDSYRQINKMLLIK